MKRKPKRLTDQPWISIIPKDKNLKRNKLAKKFMEFVEIEINEQMPPDKMALILMGLPYKIEIDEAGKLKVTVMDVADFLAERRRAK